MSWSDDTRCLYCYGKLPFYRKLTNGQFCSTGHQKTYWKEQERLAVEVLHRTHDALMAFRPAQDVELIIGPAVGWNGQSPEATPAQEPLRPEPVAPRVERASEPVAEPVYETARPVAQAPPAAQSPAAPEPAPSFADFIQGSPEGLTPSWTVLPLMQAAEPVEEEPVFLDLLVRNVGERELPSVEHQLQAMDNMVRIPVQAAVVAWTGPDVIPIAIRPADPQLVASQLEPVEAVPESIVFVDLVEEPEPLSMDALALALAPDALAPGTSKSAGESFVFVEPAEPAVAEPVVIIDRGLLKRLALSAPDRRIFKRSSRWWQRGRLRKGRWRWKQARDVAHGWPSVRFGFRP
jgi:hypothetical protein